jgi:predicted O-methyltransferase YrrM
MSLAARIATKIKQWDDHRGRLDEVDQRVAALAESTKTKTASQARVPLKQIVLQAWSEGRDEDLSGIGYGPVHWKGRAQFEATPPSYYSFLCGLVRSQQCKRIFEVGTHFGGSTQAMRHGIADAADASIVTVDVTHLNPSLDSMSGITRFVGDANSEPMLQRVVLAFGGEPVDLLFIDGDHRFLPAVTNFALYGLLLRPLLVVLDDIVLTDDMRAMWNVICAAYGAEAINCVDVVPEIRASACGFGLVRFR